MENLQSLLQNYSFLEINEPKKSKGLFGFAEEIKETSIRKHYDKPKPLTETMKRTDFLYCDPPEVILQSN